MSITPDDFFFFTFCAAHVDEEDLTHQPVLDSFRDSGSLEDS